MATARPLARMVGENIGGVSGRRRAVKRRSSRERHAASGFVRLQHWTVLAPFQISDKARVEFGGFRSYAAFELFVEQRAIEPRSA